MVSGIGTQTGAYAYAEVGYNNATQQTDNYTKCIKYFILFLFYL